MLGIFNARKRQQHFNGRPVKIKEKIFAIPFKNLVHTHINEAI